MRSAIKIQLIVVAAVIASFFAPSAFSQRRDTKFDGVRSKIVSVLAEHKIPAISIGVAENGKVVWEDGYGFADKETRVHATGQTLYNIGSTSKPITATAIMTLVERGKLTLDTPANRYLDPSASLRSSYRDLDQLTLRRLLDHTSGLPRHSQLFVGSEVAARPAFDETIRRYGAITKPVGEAFEYSNLGFGILSHIVSRTSGKTFENYLRSEIFLPLGMRSSFSGHPLRSTSVATAYTSDRRPVASVISDTPGAADVYSSVHDLLLFGMFHLGERNGDRRHVLTAASLAEMKRGSSLRGVSRYGLGWESLDLGKYRLVYHHGSNGYGTSIFVLVPEKRICISILSNVTTPQVQTLADDILSVLIPDYRTELVALRSGPRPDSAAISYRPSPEYVGHWRGSIRTWKEAVPVEMWFQPDGDVQIQIRGQYRHLLNGVRFEEGYLRGSFQGNTGTEDANRHRYNLHLKLKLRDKGARLDGAITSTSIDPAGNVLSSVIDLTKN